MMTKEEKREYHRLYRLANKARIQLVAKKYYQSTADTRKAYQKNYRRVNKKRIKAYDKLYVRDYRRVNRKKINARRRQRMASDINYKLCARLRSRLTESVKKGWKAGSAVRDLGCSIDQFKEYIASKFQPGMNWDNHGQYGWHLDHIIPLNTFDLTDRKQCIAALHYTNYQPLWWNENLLKGDSCEPVHRFFCFEPSG